MLSAVKAAVRVQQPPTLFGYRVGEGWTDTDRMLVLALQLYEESLCRCGYPWWMGHNEDHIGEDLFERDFGHCLICEKVEQPTKDDDVLPGDRMKVINRMYERFVPKRWRPNRTG